MPGEHQPRVRSSPADRIGIDDLPEPTWLLDRSGQLTGANAAWAAYAGEKAATPRLTASLHPEDLGGLRERLAAPEAFRLEARLKAADGSWRWFRCRAKPRPDGWLLAWTDLHDYHQAERRAERLYRVTAALSAALTPAEVVAVITEVAIEATGASSGGLMLRSEDEASFDIVSSVGYPPEVVAAYRHVPVDSPLPAAAAARQNHPLWVEELEPAAAHDPEIAAAREKSGNRSAAVVPFATGSVLGALSLSFARRHDFQPEEREFLLAVGRLCGQALHRARLLEEANAAKEALEQRVRERTRELSEKNRLLEARAEEQETFAYTVSHDLRQPLLAIAGMAELLGDAVQRYDQTEAAFLLDRITRNTQTMGELLNALLKLSHAGSQTEEAQALDLGGTVIAVLSDLQGRLAARGATVATPPAWPVIQYGPMDAYRLLSNALANAVRFAGRDGEPPRVVLDCAPAEGDFTTLRVHDNGPGVPAEYRERVFGLFQTLRNGNDGTGVGLAIVRRIAERHGGRAWLEESPLGGACLAITLPLASP